MKLKRVVASLALLPMSTAALADAGPDRGWEYGHMSWNGGFGMFGGLMMLVFWGIVIAVIVMAVRWFSVSGQGENQSPDALEILKSKFAKGEIDEEEFRRKKAVLEE